MALCSPGHLSAGAADQASPLGAIARVASRDLGPRTVHVLQVASPSVQPEPGTGNREPGTGNREPGTGRGRWAARRAGPLQHPATPPPLPAARPPTAAPRCRPPHAHPQGCYAQAAAPMNPHLPFLPPTTPYPYCYPSRLLPRLALTRCSAQASYQSYVNTYANSQA